MDAVANVKIVRARHIFFSETSFGLAVVYVNEVA